jgi:universal stress protein A
MQVINRILAPTDLSDASWVGVQYAFEMAVSVHAAVIVYYVAHYESDFSYPLGIGEASTAYMPTQDFAEFMRQRKHALNQFVQENFSHLTQDIDLSLETDIGAAEDMILQKATQASVDLIIMSTHGRTGLNHILIGSVTEHVVRKASCPVLSIRVRDLHETTTSEGSKPD